MELKAISKININQLKIFETVFRLKSMTLAAHDLFLTQSGVSQHIKSLELELNKSLFVRNRGELYPTPTAQILYVACSKSLRELNDALLMVMANEKQPIDGVIRIGVPAEFGNNIVVPLLGKWSPQFPEVQFDFIYGYVTEMVSQLEQGKIDLAFIDLLKRNSKIEAHPVYTENLSLVATEKYLQDRKISLKASKIKLTDLMKLEYLELQHEEPVLRFWFQHEFGKKNISLKIRAWATSVQGTASFLREGLGAAVLPDHMLNKMLAEGTKLHVLRGPKANFRNQISLAWSKRRPLSGAASEFKKFALHALAGK